DESLSRCKENGSEIKALWNHDTSRPLGSTKTDTLRFNMGDTTGLNYDIDLPNNTWGNDVRESVKRGDVDGSSFGFICLEDKW
ncbi:HK97 family phage prohead protease, partial [Erysipelatoclostridium ramosum]